MFSFRLCSRSNAFLSFAFCLSTLTSSPGQVVHQVDFRVVKDNMIIVPVTINGVGPFDFLLDTGCTDTVIDVKLAEELHLPITGKMILETAQGQAAVHRVRTESLAMAGAQVLGLNLIVIKHYRDYLELPANVRGTLGEDFLRYFDLLIDYRNHLIEFGFSPGPIAEKWSGEHIALTSHDSLGRELTPDRLVLVGQFSEWGKREMKLQLDSGTSRLVLLSGLDRLQLSRAAVTHSVGGALGGSFDAEEQKTSLRLGDTLLKKVPVLVSTERVSGLDIDGLLPTSLFHSIFISHLGRFVIINPSPKPIQAKPPSYAGVKLSDSHAGLESQPN